MFNYIIAVAVLYAVFVPRTLKINFMFLEEASSRDVTFFLTPKYFVSNDISVLVLCSKHSYVLFYYTSS